MENVYHMFKVLEHWQRLTKVISEKDLVDEKHELFPLFSFIYKKTKDLYKNLPLRRNGEDPFLHPLNVAFNIKRAKEDDVVTICVSLLHDLVEEEVDIYREKNDIALDSDGKKILDNHEKKVFQQLEEDLLSICEAEKISSVNVEKIIAAVKLLTRHKRDYYYKSLSAIFNCTDKETQLKAINVKIADRLHNILCIETFDEQQRLYQCFKNLFLLNNVKDYLLREYGEGEFQDPKFMPIERLFNKCCKATYEAFLWICNIRRQHLYPAVPMLQLAFKRYTLSEQGNWKVTNINLEEVHPMRLYQQVIRKYDAKLHHEHENFDKFVADEKKYVKEFFKYYNFNHEQVQALLDYKDAYSLKEVIGNLLYDVNYVIHGFLSYELSQKGRIKAR